MASWKNLRDGKGAYHNVNDEHIHEENEDMMSGLSTKISALKNIATDIDKEARYQNDFVANMGDDFEGAGGLLGATMKRLNNMVATTSSNRKLMCYLIAILVGTFFFLYYIAGRLRKA